MTDKEILDKKDSPKGEKKPGSPALFAVLFLSFIAVMDVLFFVLPKKSFSDNENRPLASSPALSPAIVSDGSVEGYFADHFPLRDSWMSLQLAVRSAAGSRESGGVILGDGGWLFLSQPEPDMTSVSSGVAAMEALAEAHPEINFVAALVPNSLSFNSSRLPEGIPLYSQKELLDEIASGLVLTKSANVYSALASHDPAALYYRTDHHWTTYGAECALSAIAPALGIEFDASDFEMLTVSSSFEGTLASKSGRHGVTDIIGAAVPVSETPYSVTYPDGSVFGSCFVPEKLDGKDKYAVFFGGNFPIIRVKTAGETGKRLLVFKDSYANCLIPMLIPYFDEIVLIDPRYYYDDARLLINSSSFTDVLYLYNLDTFVTDTSLAQALA
ncbi:MAG: hypothetical protein IJV00_06025 [Clostridia bacterium]|nr:hypothetical protein [Clostridia bacterium]